MRIENAELTLTMSVRGLEDMLAQLGKQPFNDVANTIADLRAQAAAQLQAMQQQMQQQAQQAQGQPPPKPNGADREPIVNLRPPA